LYQATTILFTKTLAPFILTSMEKSDTHMDSEQVVISAVRIFVIVAVVGYVYFISFKSGSTSLIPSSSPTPTTQPSPSPTVAVINIPPSEQTQKWLFAAGGALSVQNQEGMDELKSHIPMAPLKSDVLENSWGVHDHDSAIFILEWLKNEGHNKLFMDTRTQLLKGTNGDQAKYEELRRDLLLNVHPFERESMAFAFDFVWFHRDDLGEHGLLAWDYGRLINVARWSYSAGYITEQEAWEYITYAGPRIQQSFSSWDEYGDEYLLGRTFWQRSNSHPNAYTSINWLKTYSSSPWKTLRWDMKLE
jgi:hypothetical protein